MRGLILRMLISALGIWVAARIVPQVQIVGMGPLLAAALLLGIVNAIVRPIFIFLTLPITILTLGVFLLVVNAAMIGLVAALLDGFVVGGFLPALLASIIVSITGWFASWFIGPRGHIKVMYVGHDRTD
ncbi:MAG: phage holin family protein [Candidatus Krumholzibacteria bacterium]|nr:phage holin family protein [Candidatus Krumholzibacteria bacterium]